MDKVFTVCYGQKKEWKSREEALLEFSDAVLESDGREKSRYANVLAKLVLGMRVCADE